MKVLKWLDSYLEEVLLTVLLIGIVVVMTAQVVARYAFNSPLSWSEELAKYLLVWSCFLSISYCVKKRISIKIDQFQNMLPEKAIPWIKMIRHTIVFVFCLAMLPFCLTYVQQAISSGATSAAMQLPMYYIQSAPLVGFLLLALRVAQAWVREWKASWHGMKESLKEEILRELHAEAEGKEGGDQ
jgi:TRAP-type C4-dicarboxylate transport system permease small subunit